MLTLYCTWGNKRPPRGYRVPLTITILKALHLWLLVFIPLVQYVSFSFFWYTYFSYSPKWSAQRKLSSFLGGRSSSFVLLSANPVKIFTELSLMGFISSAMKPWFCYKRFIFVLSECFYAILLKYSMYYYKSKALFSPERSSPPSLLPCVVTQKCFQCLSVFTVLFCDSNDCGECCKHTLGGANTVHTVLVHWKH